MVGDQLTKINSSKNKTYHTVRIVLQTNLKIGEAETISIILTRMTAHSSGLITLLQYEAWGFNKISLLVKWCGHVHVSVSPCEYNADYKSI